MGDLIYTETVGALNVARHHITVTTTGNGRVEPSGRRLTTLTTPQIATLSVRHMGGGSALVIQHLRPDALRQLADMLLDAADQLDGGISLPGKQVE